MLFPSHRALAGAAAALALFAFLQPAAAAKPKYESVACWETQQGVSVQMDNDLFAGAPHDSDYTGGLAVDWTPDNQSPHAVSHRLHFNLDRLLGLRADRCRRHAWQFGLFSLTPNKLFRTEPVLDDRPFATAVVFATTASWNGNAENVALQSTLQVGMLGLDLFEALHTGVHEALGNKTPKGYRFQISKGGEPTFRYALARHQLLDESMWQGETLQWKQTVAMSVGYLTEASAGISTRWGRIDSPWQSFTPELAGYLPAPRPLVRRVGGRELFVFGGAQARLRLYNSLNQGQFRDSVHVLHASQLEPWLGEAWLGVHWQPSQTWEFTYTLRAQTPEVKHEPARRTLVWAGLAFSRRF